jgi:hypothetical protein
MAVQSQGYSASEASKPCSDNDDTELEWLGHFKNCAVIAAGFMGSVFAMDILQEVEAVGGIGSVLSWR